MTASQKDLWCQPVAYLYSTHSSHFYFYKNIQRHGVHSCHPFLLQLLDAANSFHGNDDAASVVAHVQNALGLFSGSRNNTCTELERVIKKYSVPQSNDKELAKRPTQGLQWIGFHGNLHSFHSKLLFKKREKGKKRPKPTNLSIQPI